MKDLALVPPSSTRGKVRMISSRQDASSARPNTETDELKDAVRVLGVVVTELAERVELLETRENVRLTRAHV